MKQTNHKYHRIINFSITLTRKGFLRKLLISLLCFLIYFGTYYLVYTVVDYHDTTEAMLGMRAVILSFTLLFILLLFILYSAITSRLQSISEPKSLGVISLIFAIMSIISFYVYIRSVHYPSIDIPDWLVLIIFFLFRWAFFIYFPINFALTFVLIGLCLQKD